MGRDAREVWEKRVARWRESGLTAKEFAAEVGVNAQTLGYWGWRLRQPEKGKAPRRRAPMVRPAAEWVEVVAPSNAESSVQTTTTSASFELIVSGTRTV